MGASGGMAGLLGFGAWPVDTGLCAGLCTGLGDEVDSEMTAGCDAGASPGSFAGCGFFRSGLTCRATLSQSARSSSLRLRLRCGCAGISGKGGNEPGRFIDRGDVAGCRASGAYREQPVRSSAAARARELRSRRSGRQPEPVRSSSAPPVAQQSSDPLAGSSPVRSAETTLRSARRAVDQAPAASGHARPDRGSSAPASQSAYCA